MKPLGRASAVPAQVVTSRADEETKPLSEDAGAAIRANDVVGQSELTLAVALAAGEHDPGASRRRRLARVPQDLVAGDLDPRGEDRRTVLRIEVEEDAGTVVFHDPVSHDVDVERRLSAVGGTDMDARSARAGERTSLDSQADRTQD